MRALRKLIQKGLIVKVGQGAYVKAVKSLISDNYVPIETLSNIGKAVAKKLKVKVIPNRFEVWYNEGKSTQVPTGNVIERINRKLALTVFI